MNPDRRPRDPCALERLWKLLNRAQTRLPAIVRSPKVTERDVMLDGEACRIDVVEILRLAAEHRGAGLLPESEVGSNLAKAGAEMQLPRRSWQALLRRRQPRHARRASMRGARRAPAGPQRGRTRRRCTPYRACLTGNSQPVRNTTYATGSTAVPSDLPTSKRGGGGGS